MQHRSKLALAILGATVLLALVVGNTSARSFSFTERNFEIIWNPALGGPKTQLRFELGTFRIECNVTLLGRYSTNTVAKRTEVNQGTINHGELEGCRNATATIRTETMPWNLRYRGFTGTLPRIETIRTGLINAAWRVHEGFGECIIRSEVNHPFVYIREGPGLENYRVDETATIPLGGEFACAFAGPLRPIGTSLVTDLPRTAKITVTLI